MRDEARTARHETRSPGRDGLLAQALAKANMEAAWKRVKCNRGSAGVDGLSIAETADDLRVHWPRIRASLLDGGVVMARYEGTPQGGPLSPLSANVLLDEVDRELERRGHRFVRYADDCNVCAQSPRRRTGAGGPDEALRATPPEGQ